MTDREELIEEAAEAFGGLTSPTYGAAPEWERAEVYEGVKRVLDVFEKAHTATDDDRDVIETIKTYGHLAAQVMVFQGGTYPVKAIPYTSFLHILDGFRRSEVPEPSDIAHMIERSSLGTPEAQALRSTVSDEKAAALVAEAQRRSVPQGEPSDAQVLAALVESSRVEHEQYNIKRPFSPAQNLGHYDVLWVDRMRAALRAAWEAR